MRTQDFEKLGVFYLGREYDPATRTAGDGLLLYDSRDLVTHAVAVGMTGSGKTGLCIGLVEEAALDGVPAILVDPKGDLANLLLTFPELKPEDFLPWIDPGDAARKGLEPGEFAGRQAELWRRGLADSGQGGERIARLRAAAEFVVYTPGSQAGVPVSILASFACPPESVMEDGELLRERIASTVTGLCSLAGVDTDPVTGREHILLSTLLATRWSEGQDADLATLVAMVANPPIRRIGVLDLELFYPSKERFALAMALNNLLASPGFAAWTEGPPLDPASIFHTPEGKPRIAVFSIAHLGERERMFFVTLLLNQILGWMRLQSGTTSLRALFYMDEIFGYFPPVGEPPSKRPLLTLLKQARAYGLGIVLATQNPVDLDYKGLSNAGTWFIGRLQTERDKERLMHGLEGASAEAGTRFDRAEMERIISGLGSRVFLMSNAHEDAPVVFTTRWAMSYLRGPLTRAQIKALMDPYKASLAAPGPAPARSRTGAAPATPSAASAAPAGVAAGAAGVAASADTPVAGSLRSSPAAVPPPAPPGLSVLYLPSSGKPGTVYRPCISGGATVRLANAKAGIDATVTIVVLAPLGRGAMPVDWRRSFEISVPAESFRAEPEHGIPFTDADFRAIPAGNAASWRRALAAQLRETQTIMLLRSPSTGEYSMPGESERDFRIQLRDRMHERRDESAEALRIRYAPRFAAARERLRTARQAVERGELQARDADLRAAFAVGSTLLGAFAGRRTRSSSLVRSLAGSGRGGASRGVGRSLKERSGLDQARETLLARQEALADLERRFETELASMRASTDPASEALERIVVAPKTTDIAIGFLSFVWAPYAGDEPAF